MKKGNGFTLIELLAVIVILAVILVISIPRILDVIEESKVNTFKSTAQLIADSAEKKYVTNKLNNIDEVITCENVTKLSKEDYKSCTIIFDEEGKAKVSITGKGKFDKLKVTNGTKTNAEVIKLEPPKYNTTAVEYISNLYEYDSESNNLKIDNTPDANIRYYGSNPNNYVRFNNELWRIIGVFGNNVKLVRKDTLGKLSWDSSESSVNNGYGINQWGESTYTDGSTYEGADLMQYLNKMYYGGETVTCYKNWENTTITCPSGSLNEESKTLIDNHTWNTGAPNYNELYDSTTETYDTLEFYKAERGNTNGKICSSGAWCNDIVNRTTEWTGYVALPYITDWAYASSESDCETKIDKSSTYKCKNNNWMHHGSKWNDGMWVLSPSDSDDGTRMWRVRGDGCSTVEGYAINALSVFPTLYLKSNVLIESGTGTSSDPYILK